MPLSLLLPIGDDVLDRAVELWIVAYEGGHPRNDADLIIAATEARDSADRDHLLQEAVEAGTAFTLHYGLPAHGPLNGPFHRRFQRWRCRQHRSDC